jgi:NAD(P)-dependent dehydrogenase (short-subunit alcohol dehydrogenase family)
MQKHGNIHYFKADVTSKSDLAAAADYVAAKTGYVNVVVANSGIIGPTLRHLKEDATLTDVRDYLWNWDADEFNQTYAVNVSGAFFTCVAFLELLDKGNKAKNVEQDSQVICVSSAGAFSRVLMSGFAYAGSKAAAVHIMKQLATKLAPFGIRSNVLAPGCKSQHSSFISSGRSRCGSVTGADGLSLQHTDNT